MKGVPMRTPVAGLVVALLPGTLAGGPGGGHGGLQEPGLAWVRRSEPSAADMRRLCALERGPAEAIRRRLGEPDRVAWHGGGQMLFYRCARTVVGFHVVGGRVRDVQSAYPMTLENAPGFFTRLFR
jgi:hypothetical protein